jgi:hypothetical protein
MNESAIARKFFLRRLGQWSAWVIPAAFMIGVVSRNMRDERDVSGVLFFWSSNRTYWLNYVVS